MDKIGAENVNAELREKGVSEEAIEKLQPILRLEGSNEEKLTRLQEILKDSETGLKGVAELSTVFRYLNQLDIQTEIKLDLTLARGLSYYTGAIFEVKAKDVEIGSITGGGRYDDLTGIFGMKNMSGYILRGRPHLRRDEPTGHLPQRFHGNHPCTFREFRGKRRGFLSSRTENLTERKNQFRDIPGSRQDEETNDLRR